MKNTKLSYQYRDANNYKVFRESIFEGLLTEEHKQAIINKTNEGDFIPSQIGLDHLHEGLQEYDSQDWGDDHPIHELEDIVDTDESPNETMTSLELLEQFLKIKTWDEDMRVGHILEGGN